MTEQIYDVNAAAFLFASFGNALSTPTSQRCAEFFSFICQKSEHEYDAATGFN